MQKKVLLFIKITLIHSKFWLFSTCGASLDPFTLCFISLLTLFFASREADTRPTLSRHSLEGHPPS